MKTLVILAGTLAISATLAGCGSGSTTSSSVAANPSVTGDMLAVVANRGWNYTMNINGARLTGTLYADPPSGFTDVLVLLVLSGNHPTAVAGVEQAAVTMYEDRGQYNAGNYTLYNADGTIWANGTIPDAPTLVPSTLQLGQTFIPYAGSTATVTAIGSVSGILGCPVAAAGATIHYTYADATYDVSYVPGCGITAYADSHGNSARLNSVGSYPQLGTLGDVVRMRQLSVFDDVASIVRIGLSKDTWHSLLRRP